MSKRKQKQLESQILLGIIGVFFLFYFLTGQSFTHAIAYTIVALPCGLVFMIYLVVKKRKNLRNSGIAEIDQMDGIEFEHYLKELYGALGYRAKITQASGDYGADLILEMNRKRIVVQAKRYKKNVGVKAVQEIKTSQLHYKAHESWVVTNSYFTKQAITLAASNDVVLIDREWLIKDILKMKKSKASA